jgi:hypothetical protein
MGWMKEPKWERKSHHSPESEHKWGSMKENKLEKEKEMRWEMWEIMMEGMLEVSLPPEIQLWDEMSDWYLQSETMLAWLMGVESE